LQNLIPSWPENPPFILQKSGKRGPFMGTYLPSTREPFLFLFAGREVRLPSRRRALLARGSGDCLDVRERPRPPKEGHRYAADFPANLFPWSRER
jgi:hypothetical protein